MMDRLNSRLSDEDRRAYERLGLPTGPFQSVGPFAPVRKGSDIPMPDTGIGALERGVGNHGGVSRGCRGVSHHPVHLGP